VFYCTFDKVCGVRVRAWELRGGRATQARFTGVVEPVTDGGVQRRLTVRVSVGTGEEWATARVAD